MIKFNEDGKAVFTGTVVALGSNYEIKATEFQMNVGFVFNGEFPESIMEKHDIPGPTDLVLGDEVTITLTPTNVGNDLHINCLSIDKFDQTCINLIDNAEDEKFCVNIVFKTGVSIPRTYKQLGKTFYISTK